MVSEHRKNKGLIIALICLVCLIAVLAIAIILVNVLKYPNCGGIEGDYEQNVCLAEYFEVTDDVEIIDEAYDKAMDEMLEKGEYYSFVDTLSNKKSAWILEGKCDRALAGIDDERVKQLKGQELLYYYTRAQEVALMCEDDELLQSFTERYNDLVVTVDGNITEEGGSDEMQDEK